MYLRSSDQQKSWSLEVHMWSTSHWLDHTILYYKVDLKFLATISITTPLIRSLTALNSSLLLQLDLLYLSSQ